jgi:hypothetical protein
MVSGDEFGDNDINDEDIITAAEEINQQPQERECRLQDKFSNHTRPFNRILLRLDQTTLANRIAILNNACLLLNSGRV